MQEIYNGTEILNFTPFDYTQDDGHPERSRRVLKEAS
jgi:hypothetical protein